MPFSWKFISLPACGLLVKCVPVLQDFKLKSYLSPCFILCVKLCTCIRCIIFCFGFQVKNLKLETFVNISEKKCSLDLSVSLQIGCVILILAQWTYGLRHKWWHECVKQIWNIQVLFHYLNDDIRLYDKYTATFSISTWKFFSCQFMCWRCMHLFFFVGLQEQWS